MAIVAEIQILLDDTAGVFWTDQHVYDAANQAQMEVWAELRQDITVATITVTASQEFVTIPATIMIPQRIVSVSTDTKLEWYVTTHAKLEQDNREWRAEGVSYPKWFVVFDYNTLQLHPKPDATYEYEVWGVRYPPTEITVGTEDITAEKMIKKAIVFKAAAMVAQMTRPDLFEAWMGEAQDYLRKAKRNWRKNQPHKFMRIVPASNATQRAHMGYIGAGRLVAGR